MNIQWIESFLTAARVENFRKAATALYVSQPTVTVHIHQLEKLIGAELFERTGRKVVLTHLGREFVPYARKMYDSYHEGISYMDKKVQGYQSEVNLAVSPLVASTYLPHWVKAFVKRYPKIEVNVDVIESALIDQTVELGNADIGLSRSPAQTSGATSVCIQTEKLVFVAPHDGYDAERSLPVDVEEVLRTHRLLTHNHPLYWDDVLLSCKHFVPDLQEMKVSQVHVTKRFIEEGMGCSFLPLSAVRRELAEGRMLEGEVPDILLPTVSTYLIKKSPSKEGEAFANIVRELA
ncbi:LysR family transcriptional regulator [Shouchella patagoniensis]|uniref:LysR family transcriptional regulator n=1 Tax=Shouchella patagoniensis TaxID=228576 RepID=UPI0009952CF1|nr:LysR family transcriptional regulator [Shouchella patagoniensis]